jgi:Fe-S-cluster containining protein
MAMELHPNNDEQVNLLEQQVERGNLFTHSALSRQSARINEIESFLFAVIDLATQKGITAPDELTEAVRKVREEMLEKQETSYPGIALRVDGPDDNEFIPVNCEERMHICKAVCCKLDFALNAEEIESGKIKWDLGRPYFIRHESKTCHCSHIDTETLRCNVYDHRPSVCKKYSCAGDKRIWKDFEKMELNQEWINENIKERKMRFSGAPMFTDQKIRPYKEPD